MLDTARRGGLEIATGHAERGLAGLVEDLLGFDRGDIAHPEVTSARMRVGCSFVRAQCAVVRTPCDCAPL